MKRFVVTASFVAGAAVGLLLAHAAPKAAVVPMADAEVRVAGSGKATITTLARGENAFLGKLTMTGGGKVPLHRDATEEYIHVVSGSGTIHIDGIAHAIGPGTTVYMPANAEVRYDNGPEPLEAIQVFAGPEPAAKYDGWSVKGD